MHVLLNDCIKFLYRDYVYRANKGYRNLCQRPPQNGYYSIYQVFLIYLYRPTAKIRAQCYTFLARQVNVRFPCYEN